VDDGFRRAAGLGQPPGQAVAVRNVQFLRARRADHDVTVFAQFARQPTADESDCAGDEDAHSGFLGPRARQGDVRGPHRVIFEPLHIRVDHHLDQLLKADGRFPVEFPASFRGVT
jgi:hypothetical protein